MLKQLLLVFLLINSSQGFECTLGNVEKTRTFDSIVHYQANKNSFDFLHPDWLGSYVNYSFDTLTHLEANMFVTFDSQHILRLDLSRKHINIVDDRAFSALDCLHELNLADNNISAISKNKFQGLTRLQKLYLNRNQLVRIVDSTFYYLRTLIMLDLAENRVNHIENLAFDLLTNLESLDLSRNRLLQIEGEVFGRLRKLQRLDVSFNRLSNVDVEKWQGLEKLATLDLSGNDLISFDGSYNFSFSALKALNLSTNLLTRLNVWQMKRHLTQLGLVDLNGNQWSCDDLVVIMKEFKDSNIAVPGSYSGASNVQGIFCYSTPMTAPTTKTTTVATTTKMSVTSERTNDFSEIVASNRKIMEENEKMSEMLQSLTDLVVFLIVIVVLFVLFELLMKSRVCERICQFQGRHNAYLDDSSSNVVEHVRLLHR